MAYLSYYLKITYIGASLTAVPYQCHHKNTSLHAVVCYINTAYNFAGKSEPKLYFIPFKHLSEFRCDLRVSEKTWREERRILFHRLSRLHNYASFLIACFSSGLCPLRVKCVTRYRLFTRNSHMMGQSVRYLKENLIGRKS